MIYLVQIESNRKVKRNVDIKIIPLSNFCFFRTGGSLLVTDMKREKSIFDYIPNAKKVIREKIENEGSQLGRVLAQCLWNIEYEID